MNRYIYIAYNEKEKKISSLLITYEDFGDDDDDDLNHPFESYGEHDEIYKVTTTDEFVTQLKKKREKYQLGSTAKTIEENYKIHVVEKKGVYPWIARLIEK